MITITEIGIAAGDIWQHLDQNGPSDFERLVKAIDKSRDLLLMSLGWLAREGHVQLENTQGGYRVSLKQPSKSNR